MKKLFPHTLALCTALFFAPTTTCMNEATTRLIAYFGQKPHHLVSHENTELIQELLTQKADPNQALNNNGTTPLHAAAHVNHTQSVKILLAGKANVDARSTQGTTALHEAARKVIDDDEALAITELLVQAKANPNAGNDIGNTPLHFAASSPAAAIKPCMEIVLYLIKNGGNPHQKNLMVSSNGKIIYSNTPLDDLTNKDDKQQVLDLIAQLEKEKS